MSQDLFQTNFDGSAVIFISFSGQRPELLVSVASARGKEIINHKIIDYCLIQINSIGLGIMNLCYFLPSKNFYWYL
jgi:hypothetical protein